MGQGSHLAAWGLLCVALAFTQTARAAADEYCPVASPYLECVWGANWKMPNLTTILVGKKQAPLINIPPLQLDNVPGKPNLLGILPLNGAVDLVYRSVPVQLHQCAVPILRTSRVNSWAGNSNSKYYPLFKACRNAPWTDAPENSFIMGAFGDLSKLTAAQLRTARAVSQFKNRYGRYMPKLGLCVGNNPCGMNIFIGLENVDQYASMRFNLGYGRLNVTVKPSSYFYSWGVSVSPPAWRPAAPSAWGIDPQTLGTIGYTSPVTKLSGTSYTGSVYVEGPLTGGRAANVLTTPDVVFSISSQTRWWGMLRDLNRRAVSMGLALAPDLLLWNRVSIPLRTLRVGGSVKLTTRTADSFFWLGAPGQQLPAFQLASAIPQVGNLMALLYKGAKTGTSYTISGVDVHGHGNGGVGLRLWFQAGAFTLQPGPRSVVGVSTIFTDWGAIFRINKGSPNWDRSITVDLGGKAHQIIFCQFKVECPGACYRTCDTKLRVCVPRLPPPSGCLGTTPVGYVNPDAASSVAAAAAAVEEEAQPELPPGSPSPLGDRVEAASTGRQCSWDRPCPRGQRCESDYERERYVCVP